MAIDKAVDSAALDAGMLSVADAIRAKAGTTEPLAWPDGFAAAISGIETGGGGASWVTVASELPNPMYLLGDVNQDGSLTSDDAMAIMNYLAGSSDLSYVQRVLADVNFDGDFSITDAMLINEFSAGKSAPAFTYATAAEYPDAKAGQYVKALFEVTTSQDTMTAPTYAYVPWDGIIAIYSNIQIPAGAAGTIQILR